ncbi:MAG: RcnB family protein [Hyphomonadaceae bacterium]
MRLIASSLLAGLIAASAVAPAFADDHGRGRGHNNQQYNGRDYRDDRRDDRRDYRDDRRDDRRDYRDDRRDDRYRGWSDNRGYHNWGRGDYFSYRPRHSNFIVVNDYNHYRLPPPRRGEYYYRDDRTGEILLVAAATGLILWALTN